MLTITLLTIQAYTSYIIIPGVGNNSAVRVKRILIARATNNLTTIARMICKSTKDSSLAIKLIIIHKIPMGISHRIKVFLLPNLYEKYNYIKNEIRNWTR